VGQEGLGAVHHAPEIDAHQPFEVVITEVGDRLRYRDAGVVDDDLGTAVVGQHFIGKGVDGGPIGNVQYMAADIDLGQTQFGGQAFQVLLIDVGQRQGAAFLGQLFGQCTANA